MIFKVMISSGGSILTIDAIQHDGGLWLVPEWLDTPNQQASRPVRIIRMDTLRHARTPGTGWDYSISHPVPKSVLEGQSVSTGGIQYEVIEYPPIVIPADDA